MPCVSVVVDPLPSGGGWEPRMDGADGGSSLSIAHFPVLRIVIAVPSTGDGWAGMRVQELAATATKRIAAAYNVHVDVETFSDSAGGVLEPADKLSDLQLYAGTVLRAIRRGGLPTISASASIGPFGSYTAYESEGIAHWALAAVDQAMESYSADLHEIDALQVGFHSDGRLPAAPPFHGYGTAHVSSSTHDTAAQSNRQRAAAVREQLGAGIAKRQQLVKSIDRMFIQDQPQRLQPYSQLRNSWQASGSAIGTPRSGRSTPRWHQQRLRVDLPLQTSAASSGTVKATLSGETRRPSDRVAELERELAEARAAAQRDTTATVPAISSSSTVIPEQPVAEGLQNTVWVGGIPARFVVKNPSDGDDDSAGSPQDKMLYELFTPFGDVISITVRLKEHRLHEDDTKRHKSWALVTFREDGGAAAAIASPPTVPVDNENGSFVQLKVQRLSGSHLARATDDAGVSGGALAAIYRTQRQKAHARLQSVLADLDEQFGKTSSNSDMTAANETPTMAPIGSLQNAASPPRHASEDEKNGGESPPEDDEARTIWVGGLPTAVAANSAAEGHGGPLGALFGRFGKVQSVTCRVKPEKPQKSWAFITFEDPRAALAAIAASRAHVLGIGGAELPAFEGTETEDPPHRLTSWEADIQHVAATCGITSAQLTVLERTDGSVHVRVEQPQAEEIAQRLGEALAGTDGFSELRPIDKAAFEIRAARIRRRLRLATTKIGALAAIWRQQQSNLHARPDELAVVPVHVEEMDLTALEREFNRASRRGKMQSHDFQVFLDQCGMSKMPYIYNRLFEVMDRDGNGSLDVHELLGAVALMKSGSSDEKLRFLYRMLDKDGQHGVSEAEIRLFLKMFVSLERDTITTIFTSVESLLGKDLGGGLGAGRVAAFKAQIYAEAERMMTTRQSEIGRRAFIHADTDGSASIDFKEFAAWVRREDQLLGWIENLGKYWATLASAAERHVDSRGGAQNRRGSIKSVSSASGTPLRQNSRRRSITKPKIKDRRSTVDVKYLTIGTDMQRQIDASRLVHFLQGKLGSLKLKSLGAMLQSSDRTVDVDGILHCLTTLGATALIGEAGAAKFGKAIFAIIADHGSTNPRHHASNKIDTRLLACTLAPLIAPMATPAQLIRFTFDIFDTNRDNELDAYEIKAFFDIFRGPIMSVIEQAMHQFYQTCGYEDDLRAVLDKLARDTLEGTIRGLVRQAFSQFDVNGDGTLASTEFKRWASKNPSVALWVSRLGHNVLSSLPKHLSLADFSEDLKVRRRV